MQALQQRPKGAEGSSSRPKGAHGSLVLDLGWWGLGRTITVDGGPFRACPREAFGVCLLERKPAGVPVEAWLPIPDFSVPDDPDRVRRVLQAILEAALAGRPVYVGCQGGFGRTGLVLALLARVVGVEQPVAFVRETYHRAAVETAGQEAYVERFVDGRWRWSLLRLALASWRRRLA